MLWDDVLPRLRVRVQPLQLDVHLVDVQHLCVLTTSEHHLDSVDVQHLCVLTTSEHHLDSVDVQHLCVLSTSEHHLDGHAHTRHLGMIADCQHLSCGPFFLVSNFRLAFV